MKKINFGSGETKLEGFVNIDMEASTNPDVVCDIRTGHLPFDIESVEVIQMLHCIEHIEMKYWNHVFAEFHRVLIPEGKLFMAYPEFEKCAKNFLENHLGLKEHFRATLYGRQLYPGDYHVVPMVTPDLVSILQQCGFHEFLTSADPDEDWNSLVVCKRGTLPQVREGFLKEQILKGMDQPVESAKFKRKAVGFAII